ncbi:MAG: hypothetical protein EKK57_05675 [Proteobacteria bacterium]|nr:MAG: hypothetical protein EKK57_05675 [Pseudomonadota bacterium]
MKLEVNLDILPPAVKDKLLRDVKAILYDEYGYIHHDLENFTGDKNSQYYIEMSQWRQSLLDEARQVSTLLAQERYK